MLSLTTWPLSLQVILLLSDKNQFIIQHLTVLMIFCIKQLYLNGNKEHFLLSSMMVYTFIGILFFHIPVYIYRVGLKRPSGTPVPSSFLRYFPGEMYRNVNWKLRTDGSRKRRNWKNKKENWKVPRPGFEIATSRWQNNYSWRRRQLGHRIWLGLMSNFRYLK